MKIDKALDDDFAVLTLKGEFDTFYCPMLQEEVEGLIERGIAHVVLNMRLVKFINSTALGAIIRVHKRCRAENGDLLIAAPSSFVRDMITQVGIDQLVSMHDSEDDAVKSIIKALNARELTGEAPVDQEKILIGFPDQTRNKMVGGTEKKTKPLIGTMSNVDGTRVQFTWSGEKAGLSQDQAQQLFFADSEVRLKFQVKMIKKGFFEVMAKVSEVSALEGSDVRVTAAFDKISKSDKAALNQFAEDMAFLKNQLPGR